MAIIAFLITSNIAVVALVAIVATTVSSWSDDGSVAAPSSRSTAPTPSRALVWSDEFDGAAGASPDTSKWIRNTGGNGWGNDELQYYTDSGSNAALDGAGNLIISAREENPADYSCHYGPCQYTSARLLTADTFTQTYGRFEARMKLPAGQGLWSAFWLLGDTTSDDGTACGEIDIMENIGSESATIYGSLHGPGYSGDEGLVTGYTLPDGQNLTDDFHTYAVEWGPADISWYVDDVEYAHITPDDVENHEWVFNHPFFLILNVAVGGVWPGEPDDSTTFPKAMIVDYVRVSL